MNCPKCGRFMRVTRYLIHMPGHKGWHVNYECGGRGCWHVVRTEPTRVTPPRPTRHARTAT